MLNSLISLYVFGESVFIQKSLKKIKHYLFNFSKLYHINLKLVLVYLYIINSKVLAFIIFLFFFAEECK